MSKNLRMSQTKTKRIYKFATLVSGVGPAREISRKILLIAPIFCPMNIEHDCTEGQAKVFLNLSQTNDCMLLKY